MQTTNEHKVTLLKVEHGSFFLMVKPSSESPNLKMPIFSFRITLQGCGWSSLWTGNFKQLKPRLWSMPPSCSRSWLPQTSHLSRTKNPPILGMMLKSRFCSTSCVYPFSHNHGSAEHYPIPGWTRYERKLLLEGTIFHWTMIMGGRVKR